MWSKDGDEWLLQWTNAMATGVVYSGTSRMRETGSDTSAWRVTDCAKDGRKITDIPVVTFRKVGGGESGNVPKEYRDALATLVGRWLVEGTEDNKNVSAEYDDKWSPQQHCIESQATWTDAEGVEACSAVIGWDAAKKQLVATEYWTGGVSNTLCFTVGPVGVWSGTATSVNKDGKTRQAQDPNGNPGH